MKRSWWLSHSFWIGWALKFRNTRTKATQQYYIKSTKHRFWESGWEESSFGCEAYENCDGKKAAAHPVPYARFATTVVVQHVHWTIYNLFGWVKSINYQFSVFFSMKPLVEGESRLLIVEICEKCVLRSSNALKPISNHLIEIQVLIARKSQLHFQPCHPCHLRDFCFTNSWETDGWECRGRRLGLKRADKTSYKSQHVRKRQRELQ